MEEHDKVSETKATASPKAKPAKKKKNKTLVIVVIIISVLVLLGIGGYFISAFVINKIGGSLVENVVEKGTGGNVKVDTKTGSAELKTNEGSINVGSSAQWPSDLPSDVPKFSVGKITMSTKVTTVPKGWSVLISDVTENDVTNYKNNLIAKGWVEESSASFGVSFVQLTKGNLNITLAYDGSSKGLSMTVSYKS